MPKRLEQLLCRLMLMTFISSVTWECMLILKYICIPYIATAQFVTKWNFITNVTFIVMMWLVLFWVLFALAERTGILDKIEMRFAKNHRQGDIV